MKNIIQNAVLIYTDNIKEHFDAIRITDKGVHIGRVIDNKFEPFGFIPYHSIKRINNGRGKKIF
jgi:hypothetical protein